MKFTKPKLSLLICSTAIATLLTGCGGEGEQIPIRPKLPATLQRSSAAFQRLITMADHWELRVQGLPDGKELVRTLGPKEGLGGRAGTPSVPVELPPTPAGQWQIELRLFDRRADGQVRGFPVLEGKKKVSKAEIAQTRAVEIFMHFRPPPEE